jgi:hypothetical protein
MQLTRAYHLLMLLSVVSSQAAASAKVASEMMDLQRFAVRHAREAAVCATPALQKSPLQRGVMRRAGHINQPRRFN